MQYAQIIQLLVDKTTTEESDITIKFKTSTAYNNVRVGLRRALNNLKAELSVLGIELERTVLSIKYDEDTSTFSVSLSKPREPLGDFTLLEETIHDNNSKEET
ncbi:MAG: hypothetical protein CMM47_00570 [Rhodospirillaceae bacterium]|nr:hypothetical protein [Rhodospirillaceae bacterium]MBM84502.1 hypothetical protein [Rhodospirillaceae bacterium]